MEIKEAVDVLGLVLGTEEREPSPEEIRRAGSMILDLIEQGKKNEVEGSKHIYKVDLEINRALSYLDWCKNRLKGKAFEAALELEKALLARWGESRPVLEESPLDNKHKVKIEQKGEQDRKEEDFHLYIRRKRLNLGLRQKDLAEELGISCAYLSLIERGKVTRTSRKVRERILAFLEGGMGPGTEDSPAGTGATGTAGEKEKPSPQRKPDEHERLVENMADKPEALRRLLEAALGLEGRELEILAAVAESWARKNKA